MCIYSYIPSSITNIINIINRISKSNNFKSIIIIDHHEGNSKLINEINCIKECKQNIIIDFKPKSQKGAIDQVLNFDSKLLNINYIYNYILDIIVSYYLNKYMLYIIFQTHLVLILLIKNKQFRIYWDTLADADMWNFSNKNLNVKEYILGKSNNSLIYNPIEMWVLSIYPISYLNKIINNGKKNYFRFRIRNYNLFNPIKDTITIFNKWKIIYIDYIDTSEISMMCFLAQELNCPKDTILIFKKLRTHLTKALFSAIAAKKNLAKLLVL